MRDWQEKAPEKNNLLKCQCRINLFVLNCGRLKVSMGIEYFRLLTKSQILRVQL